MQQSMQCHYCSQIFERKVDVVEHLAHDCLKKKFLMAHQGKIIYLTQEQLYVYASNSLRIPTRLS